jgi:hypothetical protein
MTDFMQVEILIVDEHRIEVTPMLYRGWNLPASYHRQVVQLGINRATVKFEAICPKILARPVAACSVAVQPLSAPFAVLSEKKFAGAEAILVIAWHGVILLLSVEQSERFVVAP